MVLALHQVRRPLAVRRRYSKQAKDSKLTKIQNPLETRLAPPWAFT